MAIREELTLGIQNFQANLDRARADVRKTAGEMSRDMRNATGGPGGGLGATVTSMGTNVLATMGLAGGVTALGAAIKNALTVADDLADLTLALNESAEGLQRVDFAAQQAASMGVDQVAKSMMRLERSLGDVENVKAAEALERLGLSASALAGMSLEEKILALSAAFQKARIEGTGMADIQDLLGRTAADLVPLFAQGEDALLSMFERAPVMAEETVQQMARINDQIDAMVMKSKSFFATMVGESFDNLEYVKDMATAGGVDLRSVVGATTVPGMINLLSDLDEASLLDAMSVFSGPGLLRLGKGVFDGKDEADRKFEERVDADLIAAEEREKARKKQAENMQKAAADRAAAAAEEARSQDQSKRDTADATAADRAEEEIIRERKRRAEQRDRDEEAYEKSAFSRLDPAAQMETLLDRISESLGVEAVGSTAEIEAGAAALAGAGRHAAASAVLGDLSELEAIAGRQGGTRAPTSAGQGSLATLMDEIFGRTPGELQLEEARRAAEAGEKSTVILDKILVKMDEPPDASVFSDGSYGY